ncbi:protein TIC110 chloroplastic-like, partial [Trifolium medium]|nr:protein TIC110 chloroplastic-like [Trifolium medium]
DLAGIEHVVDKLSPPLRLATSAVVIAGAVAAGFSLGSKFGGSRNAAVGGAVALGVASGAAAYALNAAAPRVASVDLHNFVAGLDDPSMLKNEDIDG